MNRRVPVQRDHLLWSVKVNVLESGTLTVNAQVSIIFVWMKIKYTLFPKKIGVYVSVFLFY